MAKTKSFSENSTKKSLIAITTCNRLAEVKKYIWDYVKYTNNNSQFDFVLSLDGNNTEYLDFAEQYDIPLLYSDEREGVGLSKNRVLSYFSGYDYYFFIEDDIELFEDKIFKDMISAHEKTGVQHFCNHHKYRVFDTLKFDNVQLDVSWTGGAQFAFYSKEGIQKIGGFNTTFAEFKRYGHTEHSYRYYHQGIQKGPFIFKESWFDNIIMHSPPQVTQDSKSAFNEFGLIELEQKLIDNKTTYFELETISNYHFNNKALDYNTKAAHFINANPQKYPLTIGKERREALAEHYALVIPKTRKFFQKINLFLNSIWLSPKNVALKHYIKTKFFGRK